MRTSEPSAYAWQRPKRVGLNNEEKEYVISKKKERKERRKRKEKKRKSAPPTGITENYTERFLLVSLEGWFSAVMPRGIAVPSAEL